MTCLTKLVARAAILLLSLTWALLSACSPWVREDFLEGRRDLDGAWHLLADYLRSRMRQTGAVGVSMAVVAGDEIRTAGFGLDDREAGTPVTSQTLFRAGSITKSFTATAVMSLVERGLVDLDRPVRSYVPEFHLRSRFPDARPITVRHLLHHHGGLPQNRIKGAMAPSPPHFSSVLADLADEYVANPPDTIYQYSNLAYDVLGCVIERASGKRFEDYVEEVIFAPAGMRRSGFDHARVGKSYEGGRTYPDWPIRDVPAGGLVTDADDLARYMRITLRRGKEPGEGGRRILSERSYAEMWRDQNAHVALDLDMRLGLGWMFRGAEYPGAGRLVRHSGVVGRYRAELELLPDQNLGVAVMTNTAEGYSLVFDVARKALDLMLQVHGGPSMPVSGSGPGKASGNESSRAGGAETFAVARFGSSPADRTETGEAGSGKAEVLRPAGDLSQYAGTYALAIGTLTARPEGDRLSFRAFDRSWELYRKPDGTLGLRVKLWGFLPFDPTASFPAEPLLAAARRLGLAQIDPGVARDMQPLFVRLGDQEFLAIRQNGFYMLGHSARSCVPNPFRPTGRPWWAITRSQTWGTTSAWWNPSPCARKTASSTWT